MKAFNDFKKQQGLAGTRLRLGFTQESFALELGVSRSFLALCETGRRSLPTRALVKLGALEVRMGGAISMLNMQSERYAAPGESDCAATASAYALKEKKTRLAAYRNEDKLDKMAASYAKVRSCLERVEGLMANAEDAGAAGMIPGHLELQREALIIKLFKCSQAAQTQLRHKIALQHAAAHLHAMTAEQLTQRITGDKTRKEHLSFA